MLEIGSIIDGKYKILNKIGSGRNERRLSCDEREGK